MNTSRRHLKIFDLIVAVDSIHGELLLVDLLVAVHALHRILKIFDCFDHVASRSTVLSQPPSLTTCDIQFRDYNNILTKARAPSERKVIVGLIGRFQISIISCR